MLTPPPALSPAYQAFGRDIQIGFARWKVYMHLVNAEVLNYVTPVSVKVEVLALSLKMGKRHVTDALNWLVERGYVVQHSRDSRGVRSLTLAWELNPKVAA